MLLSAIACVLLLQLATVRAAKPIETADYVVVGQGAGGIAFEYFLTQALVDAGQDVSVVAFEAEDEIGGNAAKTTVLEKPDGYDGSFGTELYGDMGPQRVTQMTLGMKRRMLHELGIELAFTPFKGEHQLRGQRLVCPDPTAAAFQKAADRGLFGVLQPGENEYANEGLGFIYGSLCSSDPFFVGNVNTTDSAIYPGLFNPQFPGKDGDRSEDHYLWLLANAPFDSAANEPDLTSPFYGFDWLSFAGIGGSSPVSNRTCDPDTNNIADCPWENAQGEEIRTLVAKINALDNEDSSVLNYNYSTFIEADNVGFFGDYRNQYGARSYIDWTLREWGSTNGINGYVPGGERRLMHAMHAAATGNGLKTYKGERVNKIDRFPGAAYDYVIETDARRVYVRKFLALNLPPFFLQESDSTLDQSWAGEQLEGQVVDDLRAVEELKQPYPQGTVRLLAQWAPGEPAWFWPLLDKAGNHSYRAFSDTGCFSRTEFIDTPYHRCTNHMVPVYTDDNCERMWLGYYERLQNGDMTEADFVQRIVDEIKASFPALANNVTTPVKWDFQYFPSAWHWGRVAYDHYSNEEVLQKAVDPLAGENVALVGEAYATSWSGWMEAAFRNAKRILTTRFASDAALDTAIDARFDALFDIFRDPHTGYNVSDGSWVSNFAYTPPLYAEADQCVVSGLCLDTEFWWPFYNGTTGPIGTPAEICSAATYGLSPVTDQ